MAGEATVTQTIEIGSLWRKNATGVWRCPPADMHDVRVEQFTPLGRVVLRRMDSDHEFIFDTETLLEAFDLLGDGDSDVTERGWPVRRPGWLGDGQPWPCGRCGMEVDDLDPHRCDPSRKQQREALRDAVEGGP